MCIVWCGIQTTAISESDEGSVAASFHLKVKVNVNVSSKSSFFLRFHIGLHAFLWFFSHMTLKYITLMIHANKADNVHAGIKRSRSRRSCGIPNLKRDTSLFEFPLNEF